jgi:hypothetical protein
LLDKFEVVTGPLEEPVDITNIKKYLRLSGGAEDDIITMMMSASRAALEDQLGRVFLTETLRATCTMEQPLTSKMKGVVDKETLPGVKIPRVPVQAVSKVELEILPNIWGELNTTDYAVTIAEPTVITLYSSAYSPVSYPWWLEYQVYPRLRTTYTAGYETVDDIPDWMKLMYYQLVAYRYIQREDFALPETLAQDVQNYRTARV